MGKHSESVKSYKKNKIGKVIAVIQLILSVLVFLFAWKLKILPAKYMAVIAVVLIILFIVVLLLAKIRSKATRIIGMILGIVLIAALAYASVYLFKINKSLSSIGTDKVVYDTMVVAVRADDPAESLDDLKDVTFNYQVGVDRDSTQAALDKIKSDLGVDTLTTYKYNSMDQLIASLRSGGSRVIVYNKAYDKQYNEKYEGYSDSIKVIKEYKIENSAMTSSERVKKPFNIYVTGIDGYGDVAGTGRSDVNLLITVNPNTHKIVMTSTPRDYYVPISEISNGQPDKLTHAGMYGVDASIGTIEDIYGVKIDYYVRLNFTSLARLIDAIGGVTVESDLAFTTTFKVNGNYYTFQKGENELDGYKALAFSRERGAFADGDFQRGRNQQLVLSAVIKKLTSSKTILQNADDLLDAVAQYIQTNMGNAAMRQLIKDQLSRDDGDTGWEIIRQEAKGTGGMEPCFSFGAQRLSVVKPDQASIDECSRVINECMEEGTEESSAESK